MPAIPVRLFYPHSFHLDRQQHPHSFRLEQSSLRRRPAAGCTQYARDRIYYSNLLATVQDQKVYEKGKVYYAGLLATVVVSEGMWKVYRRDRTYYAALMATVKSGKVYAGDRVYYSNLLATVRDNKVFERDRTHFAGLLFTGVGCSADELGATAAALCTDDDDGLCRRS